MKQLMAYVLHAQNKFKIKKYFFPFTFTQSFMGIQFTALHNKTFSCLLLLYIILGMADARFCVLCMYVFI